METPRVIRRLKPHLIEALVFALVTLLLVAGAHRRNRLWGNEIDLWTDCVAKSSTKARPYFNLGFAYMNAGIYDKALAMTEKAIEIDPKFANAYYNLGLIHQKTGDRGKAIALGKRALEIDPKLHMAYFSLGAFYFENGQYPEAGEAYKKFLAVYPYFPEVHNLLAIVYSAQKQFDNAIKEFEEEIRVNPSHVLAHLNVGQTYWFEFKNREKALYHLKIALMLDPFLPNRGQIRKLVHFLERSPS